MVRGGGDPPKGDLLGPKPPPDQYAPPLVTVLVQGGRAPRVHMLQLMLQPRCEALIENKNKNKQKKTWKERKERKERKGKEKGRGKGKGERAYREM